MVKALCYDERHLYDSFIPYGSVNRKRINMKLIFVMRVEVIVSLEIVVGLTIVVTYALRC